MAQFRTKNASKRFWRTCWGILSAPRPLAASKREGFGLGRDRREERGKGRERDGQRGMEKRR